MLLDIVQICIKIMNSWSAYKKTNRPSRPYSAMRNEVTSVFWCNRSRHISCQSGTSHGSGMYASESLSQQLQSPLRKQFPVIASNIISDQCCISLINVNTKQKKSNRAILASKLTSHAERSESTNNAALTQFTCQQ